MTLRQPKLRICIFAYGSVRRVQLILVSFVIFSQLQVNLPEVDKFEVSDRSVVIYLSEVRLSNSQIVTIAFLFSISIPTKRLIMYKMFTYLFIFVFFYNCYNLLKVFIYFNVTNAPCFRLRKVLTGVSLRASHREN